MSNINNQTQDLYSIELVQDLDHEATATVSGGYLYISTGYNGSGSQIRLDRAYPSLGGYNNNVAWFRTQYEGWYFYTGQNYTGKAYYVPANTSYNLGGEAFDNIESVRPT